MLLCCVIGMDPVQNNLSGSLMSLSGFGLGMSAPELNSAGFVTDHYNFVIDNDIMQLGDSVSGEDMVRDINANNAKSCTRNVLGDGPDISRQTPGGDGVNMWNASDQGMVAGEQVQYVGATIPKHMTVSQQVHITGDLACGGLFDKHSETFVKMFLDFDDALYGRDGLVQKPTDASVEAEVAASGMQQDMLVHQPAEVSELEKIILKIKAGPCTLDNDEFRFAKSKWNEIVTGSGDDLYNLQNMFTRGSGKGGKGSKGDNVSADSMYVLKMLVKRHGLSLGEELMALGMIDDEWNKCKCIVKGNKVCGRSRKHGCDLCPKHNKMVIEGKTLVMNE